MPSHNDHDTTIELPSSGWSCGGVIWMPTLPVHSHRIRSSKCEPRTGSREPVRGSFTNWFAEIRSWIRGKRRTERTHVKIGLYTRAWKLLSYWLWKILNFKLWKLEIVVMEAFGYGVFFLVRSRDRSVADREDSEATFLLGWTAEIAWFIFLAGS
jgi:hypothetical protein